MEGCGWRRDDSTGSGEAAGPTPGHPKLAVLARWLQAAARIERAALSRLAGQQRETIEQQLAWQVGAMRSDRTVKLTALLADLEAQQAEVERTFAATRAALQQKVTRQQIAARADGEKAIGHLKQAVETRQQAARVAASAGANAGANAEPEPRDAAGRTPGRAHRPTAGPIAAAHRARSATADGSPDRGQTVRDGIDTALNQAAQDIIAAVQQRGAALSKVAPGASPEPARTVRDASGALDAGALGAGAGAGADAGAGAEAVERERSIRRGTAAAIERIDKLGRQSGRQLGTLQAQAAAALDDAAQVARSRVRRAIDGSIARLEHEGEEVLRQIEEREAAALAALDRAAAAATGRLRAVPPGAEISDEAVQELAGAAASELRETRTIAGAALLEEAGRLVASLIDAMGSLAAHMGEATKLVRACIHEVAAAARDAEAVPGGVEARCEELRAEARAAARRTSARGDARRRPGR